MAFTSRFGLRATRALRMSAARWSGRTSASAPFTLPMGVRQASTTNTELTLSYLSSYGGWSPTIRHEPAAPDSPEPPASCVLIIHRYREGSVTCPTGPASGYGDRRGT